MVIHAPVQYCIWSYSYIFTYALYTHLDRLLSAFTFGFALTAQTYPICENEGSSTCIMINNHIFSIVLNSVFRSEFCVSF